MAVRIVSEGKLPEKREWVGSCHKCRTVAEWLQEDSIRMGCCQREGSWTAIKCPLVGCDGEILGSLKPPSGR